MGGKGAKYEYDSYGRMKYNSRIHFAQGKPWNNDDKQYLIDWYDIIGPEELSYSLGRTQGSIVNYAAKLRKQELLKSNYKCGQNKHFKMIGGINGNITERKSL